MLPTAFTHKPLLLWEQWPCTVKEAPGHVIAATTLAGLTVSLDVRMMAGAVFRGLSPHMVRALPKNVVLLEWRAMRLAAGREAVF